MRIVVGILVLGAVLALPLPHAWAEDQQPVTIFELTACAGKINGSGFLVEHWGPLHGRYLITALHVVHSCSSVDLTVASCREDKYEGPQIAVDPDTMTWVWKDLDLIAIPLTVKAEQSLGWVPARLQATRTAIARHEKVHIRGVNEFTSCPSGIAISTGARQAGPFAKRIAAAYPYRFGDVRDIKGTVADDVTLLLSWSNARPGFSGAPVISARTGDVIGVHQGGSPEGSVSWAVALSEHELRAYPVEQLRLGSKIPGFTYSRFSEANLDQFVTLPGWASSSGLSTPTVILLTTVGAAGTAAAIFFGLMRAAASDLNASVNTYSDTQQAYLRDDATRYETLTARAEALRDSAAVNTWQLLSWSALGVALLSGAGALMVELTRTTPQSRRVGFNGDTITIVF